jgi:hypothetical protein
VGPGGLQEGTVAGRDVEGRSTGAEVRSGRVIHCLGVLS